MTLWAIRHTARSGSTWLDYTTVRSTRRECWRAFNESQEGATEVWFKELRRRRRKGTMRAVKVQLQDVGHG